MQRKRPPIGASYSEDHLNNKDRTPQVSALMVNGVSSQRRAILEKETQQGLYKDGNGPTYNETGLTHNSNLTSLLGNKKVAQVTTSGSSHGYMGASGDVFKQMGEVYSPLWLNSNLNLPRDRATINAWCRAFFALNPYVHNAIQLHSTYPISKLSIKCPNPTIQKFFNDMIEELDLMNICVQIAQEFWLLGEAFIYAELDQSKGKWSRIMIQNPDFMVVKRTVIANDPLIMLHPDENLKRIVKSNKPADIEQRKQLDPYIIDAVKRGQNIPLPNYNCTHLARKISPYEIRGTGLPVCIFRSLMLLDRLRESKFSQADNMINPMTLFKIGSNGPDGLHPTFADLEQWREVVALSKSDKDFTIFTHPDVAVERVGYGQGIYDISNDFTQLVKEIYVGLQVPSALMDGGADTTYANAGVALDVLRQRYMQFRNMLSIFLKRKIFAPISELQGFYEVVNGKKQLIVPEIDWNHMSLFDTGDYITQLVTLTTGQGAESPSRASIHALYKSMGLDWDDEQRKLKKEAIAAEILKKEKAALIALTLTELRALDEDEDIPEPINDNGKTEQPVPGEMPGTDLGMAPPESGLPGLPAAQTLPAL